MLDLPLLSLIALKIPFYFESEGPWKEVFEALERRDLLSLEAEERFLEVGKCWVKDSFFYKDSFYLRGLFTWALWSDYLDFITVNDFFSFDSALGFKKDSFFD